MKKKISNFLVSHKWIIIVSLFFIIWKFFLISVLWDNRLSPPEPDDSFVYIAHIENIKQCPSVFFCKNTIIPSNHPLFFSHLAYGIFFGDLSNIVGISSEQAYHLSFYLGTLLLLPVLIFFIRKFTKDERLISFSIFFLALYNGGGSYHGFFWVVPSFFALLFFFIVFSLLIGEYKHWKIFFFILIPIAIYTHMIALYFICTLFIFVFLKFLATRKINRDILKKSVFILFITVIAYFSLSLYFSFSQKSFSGNHYGIESVIGQVSKNYDAEKTPEINKKTNSESLLSKATVKWQTLMKNNSYEIIENNYFKWIFLNLFGLASFVLIVILLAYYRQFDLLLLYLSSLIFVLASIPYEFGYRSLILIWPITFLIYSFGSWHALKFINENTERKTVSIFLKVLVIIAISIFIIFNLAYSYCWNQYSNKDSNLNLDSGYSGYLKKNVQQGELVMYRSKVLDSMNGLNDLQNVPKTRKIESASYYVSVKNSDKKYESSSLNDFLELFSRITGVARSSTLANPSIQDEYLKNNFYISKEFGDIEIYERR